MSTSKEAPEEIDHTSIGENCLDSHSKSSLQVSTANSIGSAKILYNDQTCLESESEDDFFSVRGELTPSSSNASSRHGSFDASPQVKETGNFKQETDPSNTKEEIVELHRYLRTDNDDNILLEHNDIKLVEFFQDSYWVEEVASIRRTPSNPNNSITSANRETISMINIIDPHVRRQQSYRGVKDQSHGIEDENLKTKLRIYDSSPRNGNSRMTRETFVLQSERDEGGNGIVIETPRSNGEYAHGEALGEGNKVRVKPCCIASLGLCCGTRERRKATRSG